MPKLKYGDASEFDKAEIAAGLKEPPLPPPITPKVEKVVPPPKPIQSGKVMPLSSIPIKNEGSTVASLPQGNERTYKDQKEKETTMKKSWWPW